ncbi:MULTISPECIES: hypothetical protein [Bacillus cereus group]|uniref:hypothetical protein n=1 Tax=Bacillus cereus group TaxID=86661 RepID=UPI0005CEF12D|nr:MULTISPECIES: hypothetical protein [Bacillus cereus group]
MGNFKNGDLVLITGGEFKGIPGKIVNNEGPVKWIMLSTTRKVANVHKEHMQKVNLVMIEDEYKEYEKGIEVLNLDIKVMRN